jgi:hypothetical protein
MTHPSITEALAAEHVRDLRAAARRRGFAALARCCRQPSRIAATFTRARAAIAAARPRQAYDTACCPG